jgi:hypothetical protein
LLVLERTVAGEPANNPMSQHDPVVHNRSHVYLELASNLKLSR